MKIMFKGLIMQCQLNLLFRPIDPIISSVKPDEILVTMH